MYQSLFQYHRIFYRTFHFDLRGLVENLSVAQEELQEVHFLEQIKRGRNSGDPRSNGRSVVRDNNPASRVQFKATKEENLLLLMI